MRRFKLPQRLAALSIIMLVFSVLATSLSFDTALAAGGPISRLAAGDAAGLSGTAKVGKSVLASNGPTQVVVQLKSEPLSTFAGSKAAQKNVIDAEQNTIVQAAAKYNAVELARLDTALNAVMFSVDAAKVPAMAQELNVKSINKVQTYTLDDADVLNQIGATEVQQAPYNLRGQGLKVAVLDSGIDFTHVSLGGPGTVAFYNTCYAQRDVAPSGACANYFGPTAPKVVGGIDFVGESWPNTPETIDPNPIDFEGHGTHVSDIILGSSGVAPDAKLISVKVCSAVSTACSGLAILEGLDYAAKSGASVLNLSLGSNYGQEESDDSDAINNIVASGKIVVASAGNNGNKPYTVGSPSTAFGAISVAQTTVPSDKIYPITYPGGTITNVLLQPWSPPFTSIISAPLQYGVGDEKLLCNPVAAGSLTGKVALIDRGTCAASIKAANASAAGAVAVLIANNQPKAGPPSFSYGGGTVTAVTFTLSFEDGVKLRPYAGQVVTINKTGISIPGTVVTTSSRGPFLSNNLIKPDIGAPGASISAEVGTGTGTTAFGGTSGAAPVVSGSAVLLKQKYPSFNAYQIKSLLMNSAYTDVKYIRYDGVTIPAPITLVGSGEVRINQAVKSGLLAYAIETGKTGKGPVTYGTGSLSFGYQAINNNTKILQKTVRVTNLTSTGRLYKFTPKFRDASDAANGAVSFQGPTQFWLSPNQTQDITIQMQITGPKLRAWNLDAGLNGNDGNTLDELEYDGYILLDGGANNSATLPWQVFPHRVADTSVRGVYDSYYNGPVKVLQLANDLGGPTIGNVDVFQLLGSNGRQTTPAPGPGSNDVKIDLKAFGVQDNGSVLQFAATTYGERATPVTPAEFDFFVDTNNDGTADYDVYNIEQGYFTGGSSSFGSDGRILAAVYNLKTGSATAYFYADTTYNSANMILTVPKAALGITNGQTIGVNLQAFDLYYTGQSKDALPGNGGPTPSGFAKVKVGSPRFTLQALPWTNAGTLSADGLSLAVPVNGTQVQFVDNGASLSTAQGLLLMYRDGAPGREADLVVP